MTDPDTIRFGLAAIKGLGKNGLGVIMEEKALRGEFKSIEDFRIRVPATLCNVTVITNLAKCGAFDDVLDNSILKMHNRATLVASTKDICDAISKAKGKKGKNKMAPSVDEVLKKFLSGAITYGITTDEDDPIQYATWEKEVLNYYISAHPIDEYRDEINRWQAIDTDMEVEDMQPEFYIAGFIGGCHETVIKKEGRNKGKTMGFVTIEGEFRAYEATLFPGVYESCLPYMKVGSPVVLKGKKSFYKDKASIQGVYIRHMMNNGIRDCPECHIRIETPLDVASLIQLRQMFDEHPGLTQVYIHIRSGHYDFTMLSGITISLNDRIIDFCTNVGKLSYKPI
jgi:DNA polymerase-3 subunit alpha